MIRISMASYAVMVSAAVSVSVRDVRNETAPNALGHAYFSISKAATFLFSYILSFSARTHDVLSGE